MSNNAKIVSVVVGLVLLFVSYGVTKFVFNNAMGTPDGLSYTREAYVSGCRYWARQDPSVEDISDAVINSYCGCVYDDGVRLYGKEEFAKMDSSASETNSVTPELNAIINTCIERVFGEAGA